MSVEIERLESELAEARRVLAVSLASLGFNGNPPAKLEQFRANTEKVRHLQRAIAQARLDEIKRKGEWEIGEVINLPIDDWYATGTSDTEPKS